MQRLGRARQPRPELRSRPAFRTEPYRRSAAARVAACAGARPPAAAAVPLARDRHEHPGRRSWRGFRDRGRRQPAARDEIGGGRPAFQHRQEQSQRDRRHCGSACLEATYLLLQILGRRIWAALILLNIIGDREISGESRRAQYPRWVSPLPPGGGLGEPRGRPAW